MKNNITRTNKNIDLNTLKKENETLKKENVYLKKENDSLKKDILKYKNTILNLQTKMKSIQNEMTSLKKNLYGEQNRSNKKSNTQKNHISTSNKNYYDPFQSPFFMNFENNYNNYYDDDEGAEYAIQAVEQQIMDEICPNPDKMTYEQLLAMEEKVGNVNKGLNIEKINKIPVVNFKKNYYKDNNKCVICQDDFKDFEKVKKLKCEHLFHINCIDQWLKKEKKCPFCNKEI